METADNRYLYNYWRWVITLICSVLSIWNSFHADDNGVRSTNIDFSVYTTFFYLSFHTRSDLNPYLEAGHFRGDNRIKRESKRGEEKERKRKYLLKDLCEALHVNNGRRYLPKENVIMEKKKREARLWKRGWWGKKEIN